MTISTAQQPDSFDSDAAIGERIRFAMRRQNHTNTALAEALHMDRPTLSKKLSGKRRWYFIEIDAAAAFLGMHVAELVGGNAPSGWDAPHPLDGSARPKGFEPLTFWLGVSAGQWHPSMQPAVAEVVELAAFRTPSGQ